MAHVMRVTVAVTIFDGMFVTVIVTVAVLMTASRVGSVRINQRTARVDRAMQLFLQPADHAVQAHAIA
jgi:hypothetical protein